MSYISLYRKYRSQTFEDVMGQDHVTRTLQNAVKSGKTGHAYLFCGSRGTGKTTVARLLAKAVNCENGPTPTPCNECEACVSITDGSAVDFIELDAASHRGVSDIKEIRENVKYPPMRLRYKVFVIDEAHQLSADAKDAFLKTLEEPPAHAIFILATTEAHEIPLTIRSRCQQFDFRRGSPSDIAERLRYVIANEGREADDAALDILAKGGQGSWRDGLSLLEQVLSYTQAPITSEDVNNVLGMVDEEVLYEVSDIIARKDGSAAFELASRVIHEGKEVREFLKAVAAHFRDLLVASVGGQNAGVRAAERARQFTDARLVRLVEVFSSAEKDLRWNDQHRLALEMAFLKSVTTPETAKVEQAEVSEPAPPAASPKAAPVKAAASSPARLEAPPVEPPLPAPPPGDGALSIGQVKSLWPRVMSHIKDVQGKILVHAVLKEARVIAVDGSALSLGFEPKWNFHIANIQQSTNAEIIGKAIQAVLGRRLTVKAVLVENEPEAAAPTEADFIDETPPDGEGSLLQGVLEAFPQGTVENMPGLKQPVDIDREDYDPWKEN